MEAHKIVSTDFKVSPTSGRKVRAKTTHVKDNNDKNGNGIPDDKELRMEAKGADPKEYHVPDQVKQPEHTIHVEITPKDSTAKQKRTATVATHHGREHAVKTALAHYKKQGATVHSHDYAGVRESVDEEFIRLVYETTDQTELRLLQLARLGLVDSSDVSKLKNALDALHSDKPLSVAQRTLVIHVFSSLSSLVTGDTSIFNRVKTDIQREATEEQPPFDPPYKKSPGDIKDKSGAVHTASSRVRNLARLALKKQQQKSKK